MHCNHPSRLAEDGEHLRMMAVTADAFQHPLQISPSSWGAAEGCVPKDGGTRSLACGLREDLVFAGKVKRR